MEDQSSKELDELKNLLEELKKKLEQNAHISDDVLESYSQRIDQWLEKDKE